MMLKNNPNKKEIIVKIQIMQLKRKINSSKQIIVFVIRFKFTIFKRQSQK